MIYRYRPTHDVAIYPTLQLGKLAEAQAAKNLKAAAEYYAKALKEQLKALAHWDVHGIKQKRNAARNVHARFTGGVDLAIANGNHDILVSSVPNVDRTAKEQQQHEKPSMNFIANELNGESRTLSLLNATSAPSYNDPGRGVHLSASPAIVTCSSLAAATAQSESNGY
ncbi:hypothetical protein BC629DRAFT_1727676 [Irpex lacteus]|nr:hypothetical protein BC629DRAFT_1727676 [Irpex lacteus]